MNRLAAVLILLAGCRQPTEIVLRLAAMGTPPSQVNVRLHRSVPFSDNAATPSFVVSALDGADLLLTVTPQGPETALSLLPTPGKPLDLVITVRAPGFLVMPAEPQMVSFSEGSSIERRFEVMPLPPDAGVADGAKDSGTKG